MATKQKSAGVAEAVIISGPRKGEIIMLDGDGEPKLSPSEEAALEEAVRAFGQVAKSTQELRISMAALGREVKEVNHKIHGAF